MESGKKGFAGGRGSTCKYVKVGTLQESGVPWVKWGEVLRGQRAECLGWCICTGL